MRAFLVLNAHSKDYEARALELSAFLRDLPEDIIPITSVILCAQEADEFALSKFSPTQEIIFVTSNIYLPESALDALQNALPDPDLVLFSGNLSGEELCIRYAQRVGAAPAVSVTALRREKDALMMNRSIYSGRLEAWFKLCEKHCCISVKKGYKGNKRSKSSYSDSEVSMNLVEKRCVCRIECGEASVRLIDRHILSDVDGGIEKAKALFIAGRGVGSEAGASKVRKISEAAGAAFGASRPVVMNAWAPLDTLVGVSGSITEPKICFTFGVSGAPAFLPGIIGADYIVSINTDKDSDMIKMSDVAVICDFAPLLDELAELIQTDSEKKGVTDG